jgi:hypothetical protein
VGVEITANQGIHYQKIQQIEKVFAVAPEHELTKAALPVENLIPTEALHIAWKTTNKGKVSCWFIEQLSQHDFG